MTPTDANASRDSASVRARTGPLWYWWPASRTWGSLIGTVAVVLAIGAIFVFLSARLLVTYTNEVKLAGLEAEIAALNQKLTAFGQTYDGRLSEVEEVVYGTLEPQAKHDQRQPPRPARPVIAAWQQNRDAMVQKRLSALEQRLLMLGPAR